MGKRGEGKDGQTRVPKAGMTNGTRETEKKCALFETVVQISGHVVPCALGVNAWVVW